MARNAVDARCAERRAAHVRTAKSCGPGAPRFWRQVGDDAQRIVACDGGKRNGSPRRARISRKPSRRECFGGKTSIKSGLSPTCVHRCVAIRCGHDFSTTYPGKPADARLGRPVSVSGGAGKTYRWAPSQRCKPVPAMRRVDPETAFSQAGHRFALP